MLWLCAEPQNRRPTRVCREAQEQAMDAGNSNCSRLPWAWELPGLLLVACVSVAAELRSSPRAV